MAHRNGQAALEYIVTYGWAFILILVAFGALAYFGILSPSRWLPDKCDLGAQLECQDYQVVAGPPANISLYVRNSFGKDIFVNETEVVLDNGTVIGSLQDPQTIAAGNVTSITIGDLDSLGLVKGQKQQFIIRIQFRKNGLSDPLPPSHWLSGSLFATVQ